MGDVTEHLGRTIAIGVAGFVLTVILVVSAAAGGLAGAITGSLGGTVSASPTTIPPEYLTAYMAAAASCPGLSWSVLAAIGTVESDNGTSTAPGVASGANSAGAEGPMQFEPATFAEYAQPVPPGGAVPPSPYDAARRDLRRCAGRSARMALPVVWTSPLPSMPITTPSAMSPTYSTSRMRTQARACLRERLVCRSWSLGLPLW